jgi:hypothetical protein
LADNEAELDADVLLQASRRLDWRFLLPDPELGHVACLGAVSAELQDSLRLFSDSLTMLGLEREQSREKERFDIVVARYLSGEKLGVAAGWLKPGGYLYAENDGYFSGGKHWRFALPTACVTAVSQAGFTEVQAHWHWPNFAACTRIIPLDDRGALRFSFVRGGRSAKARLQSGFGRLLLWSGLLKQVVPRFSIVARLNN